MSAPAPSHHEGIRDDLFDPAFLGRVEQLALLARRMASSGTRANRRSRIVGSGIEFADHRGYTPGDDLRNVDWKLFARTERLNLRLYEEEEDLSVYFLIDRSTSMTMAPDGEKTLLDRALQVAAALSYIALSNLDRVAVVPFADKIAAPMRPVRGRAQFFKILRVLSDVPPGGRTDIQAAFNGWLRTQPRPGLAVVISDFFDSKGLGDALRLLTYRGFEPMVLQLVDRTLLDADVQGDLAIVDCETGETREIVLTPQLLARYRAAFEMLGHDVQRAASEVGARCLQIDLSVPFDDVVMRVFRAGGFLG